MYRVRTEHHIHILSCIFVHCQTHAAWQIFLQQYRARPAFLEDGIIVCQLIQLCLFKETIFLDTLSNEVSEGSESLLYKMFYILTVDGVTHLPASTADRFIQFLPFQDITFQHQGE